MKNPYSQQLGLVDYAREHGIKAAPRIFQTAVPTVRKRLRRYQQAGPSGLVERSRAPHHQRRKTPLRVEQQVVQLRRQLPTFGARRLIREFDLPLSHSSLERIWHAHGLMPRRGRKYQPRRDLATVNHLAPLTLGLPRRPG